MITINPDVLHCQDSNLIYSMLVFGKAGEKKYCRARLDVYKVCQSQMRLIISPFRIIVCLNTALKHYKKSALYFITTLHQSGAIIPVSPSTR